MSPKIQSCGEFPESSVVVFGEMKQARETDTSNKKFWQLCQILSNGEVQTMSIGHSISARPVYISNMRMVYSALIVQSKLFNRGHSV